MQNNNVIQLPGKTPTELAFAGGGATRAATVTAVRSDGQVQVHLPGTALPLWAYVAMRPVPALNCGDQVLVSRDKESAYVLGVIQAASDGEPSLKRIQAKSGLHAELVQVDGKEQLEVRDAEARLLLRHDSETGRTTLTCENGDLAFAAPEGNIEFAAGGEVRVLGRDGVHLTSGGSSFSLLLPKSLRAIASTFSRSTSLCCLSRSFSSRSAATSSVSRASRGVIMRRGRVSVMRS